MISQRDEPCTCTTFQRCPYHAEQDRNKREKDERYKAWKEENFPTGDPPTILDTIDSLTEGAKSYPGSKSQADGMIAALKRLRKRHER